MTAHISDELPRLLTGEAPRETVHAAAEHLRTCPDCQQDLVAAVVAHASLTSANRYAPEVVRRARELRDEVPAAPSTLVDVSDDGDDRALPDLSELFALARAEADATTSAATTSAATANPAGPLPHRWPARRLLVAAAAVVTLGGVGTGVAALSTSTHHAATRQVALAAYGVGNGASSGTGSATFTSGRLKVTASLPALDAAHRYEVWLTNAQRTRMQPVGWIDTTGKADLTVPPSVSSNFSNIEVSVQQVTSPSYDYSGLSVLRGAYQA